MRNFPLFFLIVAIAAMIAGVLMLRPSTPQVTIIPEQEPVNLKAYTGRMVMPSIDDIYVLDNSAGRDIHQIEKYLQGRAAGLHWLAAEHFKEVRRTARKNGKKSMKVSKRKAGQEQSLESKYDVVMGVKLTLDSLGVFHPEILFCNVEDGNLKDLVREHIQAYWRYPRGTQGKFEMWAPFVWKFEY